jgi:hypothetical protein
MDLSLTAFALSLSLSSRLVRSSLSLSLSRVLYCVVLCCVVLCCVVLCCVVLFV